MPLVVEALFASSAAEAGQLSFAAGDIIAVVTQGEPDGWWEGSLRGASGWFPSTYCSAPFTDGMDAPIDTPVAARAVVLYAYEATGPDELSLRPGDVIDIVDSSQAWWTGTVNGHTGVFPANFVELREHGDASRDRAATASTAPNAGGMLDLSKALGAAVARGRANTEEPPPPPPPSGGPGPPSRAAHHGAAPLASADLSEPSATFSVGAAQSTNWAKEEVGELRDGAAAWDSHALNEDDVSAVGYAERPIEARPSARAVWQHAAYADLFASPYTTSADDASTRQPPLISLVVSMELVRAPHLPISPQISPDLP